jgi:hypothetical protein
MNERSNYLILPSIKGADVEGPELVKVKELLPKYLRLKTLNALNTGNTTAILTSGVDGFGKESGQDRGDFLSAASRINDQLTDCIVAPDATSADLNFVIKNPQIRNIILIGHASYHVWRASDRVVNWYDLGKMVGDHLKDGTFLNLGCGAIDSWNYIPLGFFVVNNPSNLFGRKAEYLSVEELMSNPLGCVRQLNPRLSFV